MLAAERRAAACERQLRCALRPELGRVHLQQPAAQPPPLGVGPEAEHVRPHVPENHLAEKFEYKSSKKAKPYKLSFVVFDMRYHLIRLPPYREIDKNLRKYVYLVLFNGHFYSPKSANVARDMMQRDLSFADAMMKSRMWNEAVGSIISERAQAPALDGSPVAAAEPLLSSEEADRAKSLYESQMFRYKCWVKKAQSALGVFSR